MLDLASRLSNAAAVEDGSRWTGHEYARGWGVFSLPFDSGYVLALRDVPESSFGAYRTLWHRTPDGSWSIMVDGPRLDTACPRYFGAACGRVEHATIDIEWTGPTTIQVRADNPRLDWAMHVDSSRLWRAVNAVSAALPVATWRSASLVRARERVAQSLGLGTVQLAGTMPSGHQGTVMPQEMYLINESKAVLDGMDLGRPVVLGENPRIGAFPLPSRGVLAVGQAVWEPLEGRVLPRLGEPM